MFDDPHKDLKWLAEQLQMDESQEEAEQDEEFGGEWFEDDEDWLEDELQAFRDANYGRVAAKKPSEDDLDIELRALLVEHASQLKPRQSFDFLPEEEEAAEEEDDATLYAPPPRKLIKSKAERREEKKKEKLN